MVCSVYCNLHFTSLAIKLLLIALKMKIHPSLKANDRLKFSQDVSTNRAREKGKPQCKISYQVLKEEYGYDPLLEIYPYQTLK